MVYILGFVWAIALVVTGFSAISSIVTGYLEGVPVSFLVTMGVGALVFLVWAIFLLVWFCTPGTVGDNKYGPDPKAVEE